MDLLYAVGDLGVADPATDRAGEENVRAALAQEIDKATVVGRVGRVGDGCDVAVERDGEPAARVCRDPPP